MTIKTLLVSACDDPGREARLNLACDLAQAFDARFVELARAVYVTNDERAAIKKRINTQLGSAIVEEKSYRPYR